MVVQPTILSIKQLSDSINSLLDTLVADKTLKKEDADKIKEKLPKG